jgi:ATP/maltotriose-dependent transcriptional regulator MalT
MYSRSKAFVGRQDTLTEIRRLVSAARAGTGQCVVIEGPAGIGKSRLLQVMAREARILGMTPATCRATELDRVAPLSTLLSALQRGGLSGIDSTTLGGQGNDRFWLVNRVRELIEIHVGTRPLFIAVDDAQWADEFTVMALRTLIPELSTQPVFWLFALSPRTMLCPAASTIDWLVAEGAHRIELGPLCDSAVAELCTEVLGAEPDTATLALAARGSGNPFLLQQLFTTLRDSGQLAIVDGSGTVLPGDLPTCFLDAVDLRLQDLSADARRLLDVGAILNRPFTVHEAAGLLSCGTVSLLSIAKEAVKAGILTADGPELWFNHDLIREAVYRNLYEPIRMALHREAASMVKAEGRCPVEISEHLSRGGGAMQGNGQAVGLLRDSTNQRATHSTRYRGGPAVMLPDDGAPDSVRAQLTAIGTHRLIYVGDSTGADRAGAEAAMLAEITGEHSAMVFGNVARGVAARDQGDLEAAIRWTQAAVQIADRVDGDTRLRHPRLWLARALTTVDRFDEADTIYDMEPGEPSLLVTPWSKPLRHYYRAELRLAQSLLAEAAGEAEKGLRSAERLNVLQLSLPSLALLLQVAVHRGDLAVAGRYAGRLERLTGTAVGTTQLDLLWPMALYQDAIGEPRLALKTMTPLIEVLPERPIFAEAPLVGPTLVKIAQRAGSEASAEVVVSALKRLAELNPAVPSMVGGAQHAVGLHTGDLEAFRAALRHFAASPRPLARAAALEDTALAEYKAGNRQIAVAYLEEALARYATAGARHHIARAQQSLRGFDLPREPCSDRVDAVGYPRLTQSELPVAQLVTEGLTNREVATRLYLSPHTVDSHLRHIFSKFGVNNRVELTRYFAIHADQRQ